MATNKYFENRQIALREQPTSMARIRAGLGNGRGAALPTSNALPTNQQGVFTGDQAAPRPNVGIASSNRANNQSWQGTGAHTRGAKQASQHGYYQPGTTWRGPTAPIGPNTLLQRDNTGGALGGIYSALQRSQNRFDPVARMNFEPGGQQQTRPVNTNPHAEALQEGRVTRIIPGPQQTPAQTMQTAPQQQSGYTGPVNGPTVVSAGSSNTGQPDGSMSNVVTQTQGLQAAPVQPTQPTQPQFATTGQGLSPTQSQTATSQQGLSAGGVAGGIAGFVTGGPVGAAAGAYAGDKLFGGGGDDGPTENQQAIARGEAARAGRDNSAEVNPFNYQIQQAPRFDKGALNNLNNALSVKYNEEKGRAAQAAAEMASRGGVDADASLGRQVDVATQFGKASALAQAEQTWKAEVINLQQETMHWQAEVQRLGALAQDRSNREMSDRAFENMILAQRYGEESQIRLMEKQNEIGGRVEPADIYGAFMGIGTNAAGGIGAALAGGGGGGQKQGGGGSGGGSGGSGGGPFSTMNFALRGDTGTSVGTGPSMVANNQGAGQGFRSGGSIAAEQFANTGQFNPAPVINSPYARPGVNTLPYIPFFTYG